MPELQQITEEIPQDQREPLVTDTGFTPHYFETLKRWREELQAAFSAKTNEHANWPKENVLESMRAFVGRPDLVKALVLELSEMLLETEAKNGEMLGKTAHPHQLGHIKWLVLSLMEKGSSFLIEGSPGSGKTLVLGFIMQAATRLQMKGLMKGVVAFGTHREFILSQQAFSLEDRRRYLEAEVAARDITDDCLFMEKILGSDAEKFIPKQAWSQLRRAEKRPATSAGALKQIKALILENEGGEDFIKQTEEVLPQIASLLCGEGTLVYDIDESPMLLPLSRPSEKESAVTYSGDLGKGIPADYLEKGYVAARKGADIGNVVDKTKETREDIRVLLTTARAISQHSFRGPIRGLIPNIDIMIVDEGKDPATAYQSAVWDERLAQGKEEGGKPLVFTASALSTTNGMGARPYADQNSPRLTIQECMEPNEDGRQVSPDMGTNVFPKKGGILYPAGTKEALNQFLEQFMADFPLLTKIEQPQPRNCTSIAVVQADDVAETARVLRERYKKMKIDAVIVPFRKNRERRANSGNLQNPYSTRIFQWMNDDAAAHVKILVATPTDVSDALSIRNLRHIAIGCPVSQKNLMRIASRMQHADFHRRPGGERHRGYMQQQLFQQKSDPRATIFSLLGFADGNQHDSYVPFQVVRGSVGAERDLADITDLEAVSSPQLPADLKEMTHEKGTTLPKVEVAGATLPEEVEIDFTVMQTSPRWNSLENIASRAGPIWSDSATKNAFFGIVLEMVLPLRPVIMRKNWEAWSETLVTLMMEKSRTPQTVIDAVKERFITAYKWGNEESKMILPPRDEKVIGTSSTHVEVDINEPETIEPGEAEEGQEDIGSLVAEDAAGGEFDLTVKVTDDEGDEWDDVEVDEEEIRLLEERRKERKAKKTKGKTPTRKMRPSEPLVD